MLPIAELILEGLETDRDRIVRSLGRLQPEQVWTRLRDETNSVGNLCLHLAGNERHYLGLGVGGVAYDRDRPHEFEARGGHDIDALVLALAEARATTKSVLANLTEDDLDRELEIDYPPEPTVRKVIFHVFEHYAYHTGQIVLLTRLLQESDERLLRWKH